MWRFESRYIRTRMRTCCIYKYKHTRAKLLFTARHRETIYLWPRAAFFNVIISGCTCIAQSPAWRPRSWRIQTTSLLWLFLRIYHINIPPNLNADAALFGVESTLQLVDNAWEVNKVWMYRLVFLYSEGLDEMITKTVVYYEDKTLSWFRNE